MDYKNYGLKDGFAPNVYVEKIIIDYYNSFSLKPFQNINIPTTTLEELEGQGTDSAATEVNVNEFVDEAAVNQGLTGRGIQLQIKANIIIEASNYEDFEAIISSPDFGNKTFINTYLFVNTNDTPGPINDPLLDSLLSNFSQGVGSYYNAIDAVIKLGDKRLDQKYTLASIVNSVVASSQTETLFDKISLYQKQLPNGMFYYQIPFNLTFRLDDVFDPKSIHLFTFANVENFEIDFDLDFGDFEVNSEFQIPITNIPVGQLNVETIIDNNKVITTGVIPKISENQRTFGIQDVPPSVTAEQLVQINENDVLRESKFASMLNSVWLGGIHKHPLTDRYMAGSSHSDELHPYVDLVAVPNSKLIDVRPLRDMGNANIVNLQSQLASIKSTKTNYYADNYSTNLLEKINVISNPLLSMRRDSNIDGIFGVDYISFIRKHSVFSGFVDNLLEVNSDVSTTSQLDLKRILRATLKIQITRVDKDSNEAKLIYDSSRAGSDGVFRDRPNAKTISFANNNGKTLPLGYLNVIDLQKQSLEVDQNFNAIEFYTFSDIDKDKKLNTEYHYEIKIEMVDPMFVFLENGLKLIDDTINGRRFQGKTTVGLKHYLNIFKSAVGNNKPTSPGAKTNIYNYVVIEDDMQQVKSYTKNTIFDIIQKYDEDRGTNSLVNVNGNLQLAAVRRLFESNFIDTLLFEGQANPIYNNFLRIFGFEPGGASLATTLDIDFIQELINVLTKLEYTLRQAINVVSNVDITKQASGIGVTTSPMNSSKNKRIITEKKMSNSKITVTEAGFDYLSFSESKMLGSRQISINDYVNAYNKMYSKYYNLNIATDANSANKPEVVKAYIQNYLPSYLFLDKKGIILPDAFNSGDTDWNQALQRLLLYKQKNISKLTQTTAFTYTQTDQGKIVLNAGTAEGEGDPNQFKLLKSLDRGQRQLVKKGLTIPERVYEGQKLFNEVDDSGEPTGDDNQTFNKSNINLLNNDTTEYFLSYVNNAVENGNKNKNLVLNLDSDNLALDQYNNTNNANGTTLPVLSLVHYSDPFNQFPFPDGKQQTSNVSYENYYPNKVWSLGTGPNSKKLFLDRYADFFFEFINSVRVEYLIGFDSVDLTSIVGPNGTNSININLSSYRWQQLEAQTFNNTPNEKALLCRLTDFIPSAFYFLDIPLISELKFYDKYYKYFLISKGNPVNGQLNFGSTL